MSTNTNTEIHDMGIFATDTLGQMQEVAVLANASYEKALENWAHTSGNEDQTHALYIAARECKWKAEQMVREEKIRIEVAVRMAEYKAA